MSRPWRGPRTRSKARWPAPPRALPARPPARAPARAGDEDTARRLLRGSARAPAATVHILLAARAHARGDLDLADEDLEAARTLDPVHPDIAAHREAVARARAAERLPFEEEVQ